MENTVHSSTRFGWRSPQFRLSVRGLMFLVLLTGCGLGWIGQHARVQRNAVTAIRQSGGQVIYDWEATPIRGADVDELHTNPNGRPKWPKWLIDRLGPDYFGTVISVRTGRRDADAVMAHVGRLTRLQELVLSVNPLTDSGMVHLRELTQLKNLHLGAAARITGVGLKNIEGLIRLQRLTLRNLALADSDLVPLRRLTDLRILEISSPRLTDAGMTHLKDLVKLKRLVVTGSRVTSVGLANVVGMTGLHELQLSRTRVADLASIGHLTGLRTLYLMDTPIDDDGLAPVAGFTGLQRLWLNGTRVTDAGLRHLHGLPSLIYLDLSGTRITDAGSADFEKLPVLKFLFLDKTVVTDAAVEHLSEHISLGGLSVRGSRVSAAGITALHKARPEMRVRN